MGIEKQRVGCIGAGVLGAAIMRQLQEMFPKMVADGLGDRDNTELVNFYRGRKS